MKLRLPRRRVCLALLLLQPLLALAQPADDYYASVDASSPETLRTTLHEIIDDHTRYPYTSFETDTWDILEEADRDPDDSVRILTLYRNNRYVRRGGGNENYNREHSWPRSYGFPDNDGASLNYPFTDTHALFLSDADYNSARSNKPYEDCLEGCVEYPVSAASGDGTYAGRSNWTDGEFTDGRWEVWDQRRGDIARAMFYMDIRYEGGAHGVSGASEPDLRLTNDRSLIDSARTGRNEPVAWMGMLDSLLAWHREDPPDHAERLRNEVIASYQGNRNPFVDEPQWVECLYLALCGFQINAGLNDAWYDPATAGQGFFITVLPQQGQLLLAHFTFDSEPPDPGARANLGATEHRWFTALGAYEGAEARLAVTLASGGLFDDPTPVQRETPYGHYELLFRGCNELLLRYEFPAAGRSGEIILQRVVTDNVSLCEAWAGE